MKKAKVGRVTPKVGKKKSLGLTLIGGLEEAIIWAINEGYKVNLTTEEVPEWSDGYKAGYANGVADTCRKIKRKVAREEKAHK